MMELLIIILFVAWLLGAWIVPVGTAFIHLILVVLIVLVVVWIVRDRGIA